MRIEDCQPVPEMPKNLIQTPTLVTTFQNTNFKELYEKARNGNNNFSLDVNLKGSSSLSNGLANYIFSQGGLKFRTATPSDSFEEIFSMIEGKFYTDLNAFDVWQESPERTKNKELWKQAHKLAEKKLGRSPVGTFRIQGFYVIPDENGDSSYKAIIQPAKNFRVIEDERLDLSSGTKFNEVEDGIINPHDNGKFTKYTLGNGIAGVSAYSDGDFVSVGGDLAGSSSNGRVMVYGAEGVVPKFSTEKYAAEIKKAYEEKVNSAKGIVGEAFSKLEKL